MTLSQQIMWKDVVSLNSWVMILFCENAVTLTFDLQNLISENVHLHSHSGYVADAFVQSEIQ